MKRPCCRRIALEPLEDRRLLSAVVLYQDIFNSDPGWTREERWAFGSPNGGGGATNGNPDPVGGYTGSNVYGVVIDGDYRKQAGGPFYLTTGAIDTTGYENTQLDFHRWLNTAGAQDVTATVDVSNDGSTWHNLYTNPTSAPVTDAAWQHEQYDISSFADDQPAVYVRWGYQKLYKNVPVYSGWNIDDVSISGTLIDRTAPEVLSIVRSDSSPTNARTVAYAVTFSEPVTGVESSDFMLGLTGGVAGAAMLEVNGTGADYTVTVDTGTGIGTLQLAVIDDDSILDAAGQPLGGPGSENGDFAGEVYELTVLPVEIHGAKWSDENANGLWDSGEEPLAGWKIYLDLDDNGRCDDGEPFQITGADGSYAFTGLDPGTYVVAEVPQDWWEQSFPALDAAAGQAAASGTMPSGGVTYWDAMLAAVGEEVVVENTTSLEGYEIYTATWEGARAVPEAALAVLQNSAEISAAGATFISVDHAPEGDVPVEIAFTPDGGKILVAHQDTDNVTIFNAATRDHLATVPVGDTPVHLALTLDGRYALTANLAGGTVSVIDLSTFSVTATISLSKAQPFRVEMTGDGNYAVVALAGDGSGSSFSVIDLDNFTEVRNFASADQGTMGMFVNMGRGTCVNLYSTFAVAPDSSTIVLPVERDYQVYFYDLTTGTALASLAVTRRPVSIDISEDGSLAVVGHAFGEISVIDPTSRTLIRSLPAAGSLLHREIRITPDNAHAIVPVENNIAFIRLSDGAVTASHYVGAVGNTEFSHDEQYAFITSTYPVLIDLASQTIVHEFALQHNIRTAVSPVSYLAVSIDNRMTEDLHFYSINGAAGTDLATIASGAAPEGDAPECLAVSPDGQKVVTGNLLSGNVSFLDLTTKEVTGYTATGTRISDVVVTPDGTHAVVVNQGSDTVSIVDMATGTAVASLSIAGQPTRVAISPDSQWAYVISITGTSAVHFIRLNGAASTLEGSLPTGQTFGAWLYAFHLSSGIAVSDDGSMLAICASRAGEVMIVDTATRTQTARVALPSGSFPMVIAFSPDGSRIYVGNDDGASVSVIDVDGVASSLLATISLGAVPRSVHVDAWGEYIYVTTDNSSVEVIDAATNTIVRSVPIIAGTPEAAWLDRKASLLYVASYGAAGSAVTRVSTAGPTSAMVDSAPLAARPSAVAFSDAFQTLVVAEPALDGVELVSFEELVRPGTYRLVLPRGGSSTGTNFGNQSQFAEIRGYKWEDQDGDGTWDEGEPPIENWKVFLDDNLNGQWDGGEVFTATDATGLYVFADLAPGCYVVAEEQPSGWVQTFPGAMPAQAGSAITESALAGTGIATTSDAPGSQGVGRARGNAGRHTATTLHTPPPQSMGPVRRHAVQITTTASDAPVYVTGEIAEAEVPVVPATDQSGSLIRLDEFRTDPRFTGVDGRGMAAVILDTGIDLNHSFFGPDSDSNGLADRIVYQYDFADGDADASDRNGHGSNVSSIIASESSAYPGVASGVNIIHLKVFTDAGSGTFGYIESALQWVVANVDTYNIVSLNMSLSDSSNHTTQQALYGIGDELAALAAQDVIVVSSSGNSFYPFESVQGVAYPAADPNSLSIGAVYDTTSSTGWSYSSGARSYSTVPDAIAPFSQRHETLTTVFAPGAPITGANATGGTVTMHGTSQASPHVAGVAVLAQQLAVDYLGRRLTTTEFAGLLRDTAVTIHDGDDENDNVTNTGLAFARVDVLSLAERILAMAGELDNHVVHLGKRETVVDRNFGNRNLPRKPSRFSVPNSAPLLPTPSASRLLSAKACPVSTQVILAWPRRELLGRRSPPWTEAVRSTRSPSIREPATARSA